MTQKLKKQPWWKAINDNIFTKPGLVVLVIICTMIGFGIAQLYNYLQ